MGVISKIIENWELVALGAGILYEVLSRKVKTDRDLSILNWFKRLVDAGVSNKKKGGSKHF